MSTYTLDDAPTWELVEELQRRDQLRLALTEIKRRLPWWKRFRLGPSVWGISGSWLAVCPWNGDTAWVTLPFVYFGIGTKNVEMSLGHGKYLVSFEIRWRWE